MSNSWNEKLEALDKLKTELDSEQIAPRHKKRFWYWARTLLRFGMIRVEKEDRRYPEIIVDLIDETQQLHCIHSLARRLSHALFSGALLHRTALEALDLITKMARRYRDDEIVRLLSNRDGLSMSRRRPRSPC